MMKPSRDVWRLLPLVTLVIVATFQNASAQGPAPAQMRDVNNPPRASKLAIGGVTVNFGEAGHPDQGVGAVTFNPPLPAGKMLVIESITAEGPVTAGHNVVLTVFTYPNGNVKQDWIGMTPVGTFTGGSTIVAADKSLRLYSSTDAANGAVAINAQLVGENTNPTGFVQVSVTGYTIDP